MALDASIYGQLDTQAPLRLSQMIREANNPMAQAQQMLSLKQMLQQGKLQEMQMQQAQAEMAQKSEDRAATRAALADFVAANPDMAQAARMSPQDAVKYFFDQMKAKNAPPEFLVAGDSVLQKPRTAGESLMPAYAVPGKPQLVERADPKEPLRTQKVWMRPGETDGPVAGLGALPEVLDPRVQDAKRKIAAAGASVINNYPNPIPVVDAQGNTKMVQFGNKGDVRETPYKPAADNKPPTEFEAKAGLYFKSMSQATETLASIEKAGGASVPATEAAVPDTWNKTKNVATGEDRQKYVQAQRQWIDSINRVRSGANLPEIEYSRAVMTFFPQFGDSDKVIKQKATARQNEEVAMRAAAGRALKPESAQAPAADAVRRYNPQTGKIE